MNDVIQTDSFGLVTSHFERLLAPGSGLPIDAQQLAVDRSGRVVFTGVVSDSLDRNLATALFHVGNGRAEPVFGAARGASMPTFSPDGSSLAHVRSDGEADDALAIHDWPSLVERASFRPGGRIEQLVWAADGDRICVLHAEPGADLAGFEGAMAIGGEPNDRPDWSPDVKSDGLLRGWRHATIFHVADGAGDRVTLPGLTVWECAWADDGTLAVVASTSPDENGWYRAALYVVDIAGGTVRHLWRPERQIARLTPMTGTGHVALVHALCSDRGIVAGDIVMIDVASGEPTSLDAADADVTRLFWCDDGLLAVAVRSFDIMVMECAAGAAATILWRDSDVDSGPWYPVAAVGPQGEPVLLIESFNRPPTICRIERGRCIEVLVLTTPGIAAGPPSTAEVIMRCWAAPDGLEIQGWLVKPAGNGPFPLVLDIHGGPIWMWRNRWRGRLRATPILVERGYAVFYPNPRGSASRGQAYAARVKGDMGGADRLDLLAGIDALIADGLADPHRLAVTGVSYGGYMSALLATTESRFFAAISVCPVSNWLSFIGSSNAAGWGLAFLEPSPFQDPLSAWLKSPVAHVDATATAILILQGAADRITPPGQGYELYAHLRRAGATTACVTYPLDGHGLRSFPAHIDMIARSIDWLEHHRPPIVEN